MSGASIPGESRRFGGVGSWVFDLVAVGLLLSIRWAAQNRGAPDAALLGLGDLPAWWWQVALAPQSISRISDGQLQPFSTTKLARRT